MLLSLSAHPKAVFLRGPTVGCVSCQCSKQLTLCQGRGTGVNRVKKGPESEQCWQQAGHLGPQSPVSALSAGGQGAESPYVCACERESECVCV
jgi:hypothetical protein